MLQKNRRLRRARNWLESYYVVSSVLEPSIAHLLVTSPPQAENFDICDLFSLRKCDFLKGNRHLDVSDWQNFPPAAGHPNPTSPPWWGGSIENFPPSLRPMGGITSPPALLPWGGFFSQNKTSPPTMGGNNDPCSGPFYTPTFFTQECSCERPAFLLVQPVLFL